MGPTRALPVDISGPRYAERTQPALDGGARGFDRDHAGLRPRSSCTSGAAADPSGRAHRSRASQRSGARARARLRCISHRPPRRGGGARGADAADRAWSAGGGDGGEAGLRSRSESARSACRCGLAPRDLRQVRVLRERSREPLQDLVSPATRSREALRSSCSCVPISSIRCDRHRRRLARAAIVCRHHRLPHAQSHGTAGLPRRAPGSLRLRRCRSHQPELHAEVRDARERGSRRCAVEPALACERVRPSDLLLHAGDERCVLRQRFEARRRNALQYEPGVLSAISQLSIEPRPERVSRMVPCPAQVEGKLVESLQRGWNSSHQTGVSALHPLASCPPARRSRAHAVEPLLDPESVFSTGDSMFSHGVQPS